jgi:hypothetical protein
LVGLTLKGDGLTLLHTAVDVNLEDLALVDDLLTVAVLAAVLGVDDLALTVTVAALLLHLLDHRAELTEDDLDTLTLAALASLDGALLSTLTLALATEDVLLEGELRGLALVEVL